MSVQEIFNILILVVGALGGWLMKIFWQSLSDLKVRDEKLSEKVGLMEVLVAGHYAKREDVEKLSHALFAKLDRIEEKLDKKVDK